MRDKRIEIELGNGCKLVAEVGAQEEYKEMYVFLEDGEGYTQDLVVVGPSYSYADKTGDVVTNSDNFRVLVYSDPDNLDDTHDIEIARRKESESENDPAGNDTLGKKKKAEKEIGKIIGRTVLDCADKYYNAGMAKAREEDVFEKAHTIIRLERRHRAEDEEVVSSLMEECSWDYETARKYLSEFDDAIAMA